MKTEVDQRSFLGNLSFSRFTRYLAVADFTSRNSHDTESSATPVFASTLPLALRWAIPTGLRVAAPESKADADERRQTRLLHGDAIERLRGFHGSLRVGDHDELRLIGHLFEQAREALDVGFIDAGRPLLRMQNGLGEV